MPIELGDHVCFRADHVPEALEGRERDVGVVVALDPRGGPQAWPVVHFTGYRSTVQLALQLRFSEMSLASAGLMSPAPA